MESVSETTWLDKVGLTTIRGRIIGLVVFLLLAMLIFSLIMRQQNLQIEAATSQVLHTRLQIRDLLEEITAQANAQVSEARSSIILRSELIKNDNGMFPEEVIIRSSFQQLDSLAEYLSDSVDLSELKVKIDDFHYDFQVADSLWQATLRTQKGGTVRLLETDPAQLRYRVVTDQEQEASLFSDTVAELTIEAEEAHMHGAFLNYTHANYRGKGYADYTNKEQDFVEWKFNTSWNGTHLISFQYANGSKSDRPLRIILDDVVIDSAFSFSVTERGAWTRWVMTEEISVVLSKGVHTLRAVAIGSSGANVDFAKIVAPAPYATLLNETTFLAGVVNEQAQAELTQQILEQQNAESATNAIADILRNAGVELRRSVSALRTQNEKLLNTDMAELQVSLQRATLFNFGILGVVVLLAALVTAYVLRSLKASIQRPTKFIYRLASGEVTDDLVETKDELNEVAKAGNLLGQQLRKASEFAIQVGEGQLDQPFESAGEQDVLGNALLQMRSKLTAIAQEDQKRRWTNEGLTKFAALVRVEYENKQDFAAKIVSEVVRYVEANQGGLFIREDREESEVLTLLGCYAYNRKKYIQKEVLPGEGLLGQAYLEGETTQLTEIPGDYISIRSGLGGANPHAILMVPLKSNEQVTGVLELASFQDFAQHVVEFVEKIAEVISAHVSNLEVNEHTQLLLKETQKQAEQLRAQEEEMRQNMEEMQAIQEQVHRDQRMQESSNSENELA
ncbi:MAG: GAF domain-containing protein [Bacteroidota bacterium]